MIKWKVWWAWLRVLDLRVGHLWQSCSMGARCGSCIRMGRVQMKLPRFAGGEMLSESGRATPPCVAER